MLEASSLLCAYFAFALLHGTNPKRLPWRVRWSSRAAWAPSLRLSAFGIAGLAAWIWSRTENATAGLLVALTALAVAANLFVLLAPLWPRIVWGLALLTLPLSGVLWIVAGGARV